MYGRRDGGRALSTVGLISLYPVWRAADGLDLHQLSTFLQLPINVRPKAGLSADGLPGRTSVPLHVPLAQNTQLTLPCLKRPHLSTACMALGFSYKKMKGSGAWAWRCRTKALAEGPLQWCLWGLARISRRLVVIDSI